MSYKFGPKSIPLKMSSFSRRKPSNNSNMSQNQHKLFCSTCKQDYYILRDNVLNYHKNNTDGIQFQRGFSVAENISRNYGRIPMILDCKHSVCELCVRKEVMCSKKVVCSQCKIISSINPNTKSSKQPFPYNYYYIGLLLMESSDPVNKDDMGGITFQQQQQNQTKEICIECKKTPAAVLCTECKLFLCNQCFRIIHKPQVFNNHQSISIDTALLESLPMCTEHVNEKLCLYCEQCKTRICNNCALILHNGHVHLKILEKNQEAIPQIKEKFETVKEVHKQILSTQKNIQRKIASSSVETKISGLPELSISRHFMEAHGRLQVLETHLYSLLQQKRTESVKVLHELESMMRNESSKIENLIKVVIKILNNENNPEFLENVDVIGILEKIETVKDMKCYLVGQAEEVDLTDSFQVKADFMWYLDNHSDLIFPETKHFSVVSEVELPEDYEKSSVISTDVETELSFTKRSGTNSPQSNKSSIQNVPHHSRCPPFKQRNSESRSSDTNQNNLFKIGAYLPVTVSHIRNPSCFYVQHVNALSKLTDMARLFFNVVKNTKPVEFVVVDELYLARFDDNKWYRAKVKNIINGIDGVHYEVIHIDYGNEEIVGIDRLRPIEEKYALIPPFAHCCTLFDLYPKEDCWTKEAIRFMAKMLDKSLINSQLNRICTKTNMAIMDLKDEVLHVDILTNPQDNYEISASVRDAIIFLQHGLFPQDRDADNLIHMNDQKKVTLMKKDFYEKNKFDVSVIRVNSPSSFYVHLISSLSSLDSMMKNMQKFYKKNKNRGIIYSPKIGMLCAVNCDKTWYRGVIKDLPGDTNVEIFLSDYGRAVQVSWKQIRKLYDDFIVLEVQAIHCCLSDVKPIEEFWSTSAIKFLIENTCVELGHEASIGLVLQIVIEKVGEPLHVILFEQNDKLDKNINGLLVKNKFAQSTGNNSSYAEMQHFRSVSSSSVKKLSIVKNMTLIQQGNAVASNTTYEPFRLQVKVLSVTSPSNLYISIISKQKDIAQLQVRLNEFYENKEYDPQTAFNVQDKCAVWSQQDNLWYRAIISEKLPNDQVTVFIKDFARLENVTLNRLRPLDEEFMTVHDGAVKCHMSGMKAAGDSGTWPMLACEALRDNIDKFSGEIYITKKGLPENRSLPVDLWVKNKIRGGALEPSRTEWILLNQLLIDKGYVIPVRQQSDSITETGIEVNVEDNGVLETNGTIEEWLKLSNAYIPTDNIPAIALLEQPMSSYVCNEWLPPIPITKTVFQAIVTHIDENLNIYFHDYALEKSLNAIHPLIIDRFESLKSRPIDMYWQKGQICIARNETGFYRGQVKEIFDDEIVVDCVDYGFSIKCKTTDLRKFVIHDDIPVMATKCVLYNVQPIDSMWCVEAIEFLKENFTCEKVTITVREHDIIKNELGVDIYVDDFNVVKQLIEANWATYIDENSDVDTKDDITADDSISLAGETKPINNRTDPYQYKEINLKSLKTKQLIVLVVSVGKDYLHWYAQPTEDNLIFGDSKQKYIELCDILQEEAVNQPLIENPYVGQTCVAKFKDDGNWYRAKIIDPIFKNQDVLYVTFIDYGNEDRVQRNDVREIKEDWLKIPAQCFSCKLWNVKKRDDIDQEALTHSLSDELFNKKILMKIVYRHPLEVMFLDIETNELIYKNFIDDGSLKQLS